ncbi:MAG: ribonuclease PH [Alphaproteobacteria bacterium]|nr:ribonuclease PH [Alphaproteobacteria bacterium]MCL2758180.1 ribonuclease PH [Alphaproteobacteria bacterium]
MLRPSLRKPDQMRPVEIETNVNKWAEGSCMIKIGGTHVICNASVEMQQPLWKRLQNKTGGWVTAEYSMLPRAVGIRKSRDAMLKDHRCAEIMRLVGRALRSVVDMEKLGRHTITIDCDVIQADGGTRCAAITGGFVALSLAMKKLLLEGRISENPIGDYVAATSVGYWHGELVLDLDFEEDSAAELDANFVVTGDGKFIEIQATGEAHPFEAGKINDMMALAAKGCAELIGLQKQVLE